MIKTVNVILWGTIIGTIYQPNNDEPARFEYNKDFLQSGIQLSPIKMPLNNKIYVFPELNRVDAFHGLPGMFADSLPDKFGNAVIEDWLITQGRTIESFSAIERLSYTGSRGMGALEYQPATGLQSDESEAIDVTEMTKLASEILVGRTNAQYNDKNISKKQLLQIGSSAGGARAKAVIAWNKETGIVKSGQINAGEGYDYWLIKFDEVEGNGDHELLDGKQYTLVEFAYYLMAKDIGIDMMECRIFPKDGLNHFMTKRYDRINGEKLHMQTLGALAHIDYNSPNLCSYELCADYAKRIGVGTEQIKQLYMRMVFNDLAWNYDDHVKNISFLMNKKGEWNISPAYDMTYAYNPDNRWLKKHQMNINGKSEKITEQDLLTAGKNMGLSSAFCKRTISVVKAVINEWMDYAEKCGINEERAFYINTMIQKKLYGTEFPFGKGI